MRALLTIFLLACGHMDDDVVVDTSDPGGSEDGEPDIDISPSSLDLGYASVGSEATGVVTVVNTGEGDLLLDGASVADGPFSVSALSSTNLGFGESLDLVVTFAPTTAATFDSTLTIAPNDPDEPAVEVELIGTGLAPSLEVDPDPLDFGDQWVGCELTEVLTVSNGGDEVLIVTDLEFVSGGSDLSMAEADLDVLTDGLKDESVDYRIAAIVDDNGCVRGSDLWIDDTFADSDAASTMETMIGLGMSYGANTERAFMLLEAALGETGSGDCNEGLVREDAALHLVGMSDEPEQSVNNYAYYVNLFQSYKADPGDVLVHGIGGDYPTGCGAASAYTGVYEATVATGGVLLSICADPAAYLADLATAVAAGASSGAGVGGVFELSDVPVAATIAVSVDEVTTAEGWAYDPSDNAVVFDEDDVPAEGSEVVVTYAGLPECAR